MNRIRLAIFFSALCTACGDSATNPPVVATVSILPSNAEVSSGGTLLLAARPMSGKGAELPGRPVSWSSSDVSVATVSSTGLVTAAINLESARRPVTITATSEGVSGTTLVYVRPAEVTSIAVAPVAPGIMAGTSLQLAAETRGADNVVLTGRVVTWTSSDQVVATVSGSGLVSAMAYSGGAIRSATITAAIDGRTALTIVTVTPVPVRAVTVTPGTVSLSESDSLLLAVTTADSIGGSLTGRANTWTTSNSAVATVTTAGRVIATPYTGDSLSRTATITATSEGVSRSVTVTSTVDLNRTSTFFTAVANAFPSPASYYPPTANAFATSNVVADLNKDGREDIVLHLWGQGSSMVADAPTPNRVVALIAQPDGRYADRTAQLFGTSNVDLGGAASRKVRVADLNDDGYPDWVYAMNKEDGRPAIAPFYWDAQSAAVLSNGDGTYRVMVFGLKQYHHSVELLRSPGGGWDVLIGGIGGNATPEAYRFSGGAFIPVTGYPTLSQTTYVAYSADSDPIPNRLMTGVSVDWTEPEGMRIYARNGTSWQASGTFLFPDWQHISGPGYDWPSWSVTWEGQNYIQGGFFESCGLRLTPGSERVAVAHYATNIIAGAPPGATTANAGFATGYSHLFAFRPAAGSLEVVNAFADPKGPYNINDVRCLDINGDGYEDVVTAPYRHGARPKVHLNDRSGRLSALPDIRFPEGPFGQVWTSLFADSDGDGIKDLIYFPGNGCNGGSTCGFQLYRARRQLR